MSRYSWYWHRLCAMGPREILGRVKRKWYEWSDSVRRFDWPQAGLAGSVPLPRLPDPTAAPEVLREALRRDAKAILAGKWRAFGRLPVEVHPPPRWHRDYLAGIEVPEGRPAFKLNHRQLPNGADIKLIWEWSRWQQMGRLAMAAYVLPDNAAGQACVDWLEDWVRHNPPYQGWNWTSALESGIRLVHFAWIHALLESSAQAAQYRPALKRLSASVLPPHVRYTWRYRSLGSSANNHLLGELAGLIVAVVRWPELARWGTSLDRLQRLWEQEVLAQFAEDGGNCEQALNYHLFSFEFCWQIRRALLAAQRSIAPAVEERLERAAEFFVSVQVTADSWDYGDSDDAFVIWLGLEASAAVSEWHAWLRRSASSPALHYWLGPGPKSTRKPASVRMAQDWDFYPCSGLAVARVNHWTLRWDVSPLGYLSTAAHGHLDALHLSLWHRGVAFLIDPGTGAYYSDALLRNALASWEAHNGPHPAGLEFPARLGPFLWSDHHARPELGQHAALGLTGRLTLPTGRVSRVVTRLPNPDGWQVDDQYLPNPGELGVDFAVHWQFAPGTCLTLVAERRYQAQRNGVSLGILIGEEWGAVEEIRPSPPASLGSQGDRAALGPGICSPGFRQTDFGPQLRLRGGSHNPCLFRTTFLASADS